MFKLYHMDAVIGINNLDLTLMRGKYCHCGFPEIAYGKYSDMLLSRGFKVARVEQTETPSEKTGKVVNRELCRITTASTKTFSIYDGTDDKNFILTLEPTATYLMAIVEEQISAKTSSYGVCFIDTAVGKFIVSLKTVVEIFGHNGSFSSANLKMISVVPRFVLSLLTFNPAMLFFQKGPFHQVRARYSEIRYS